MTHGTERATSPCLGRLRVWSLSRVAVGTSGAPGVLARGSKPMPAFRWRVWDLTPLAAFVAAAVWPLADGSGQSPQLTGASPARASTAGLAAQPA